MKRGTYIKFRQLGIIIFCWAIFGFIITVYDHLLLHTHNSLGPSEVYSFWMSCIRNVGAGIIGGVLGGSALVFYVNVKYSDKPYGYTIAAVVLFLIFVVMVITIVMAMILVPMRTGKPLSDPLTQAMLKNFLKDVYPLKSALIWLMVVSFTQLLLQVNSKFGYGAFWNIIRGKYQTPQAEKRIFMFLDLNDSTGIAERLGDVTYHALLKEFFSDITNAILDSKGNIYQYVGDEVVISWEYDEGKEGGNCINCFFAIKSFIHERREKYMERYGLVPSFKAGLHSGDVVAGEVGVVKRDITYSGDVLNTTSRIQNMCKEFRVELIASSQLIDDVKAVNHYLLQSLGSIKLRGKENELPLTSISALGDVTTA
jgi:adenylate cyclase